MKASELIAILELAPEAEVQLLCEVGGYNHKPIVHSSHVHPTSTVILISAGADIPDDDEWSDD